MSEAPILHFLVIYNIETGVAEVQPFEKDYDSALAAYSDTEAEHRSDDNVEVVLLGSDSYETLERTHSSYFELNERHVDRIVARELAQLGLS